MGMDGSWDEQDRQRQGTGRQWQARSASGKQADKARQTGRQAAPNEPLSPYLRQGSLPGICWPCSRERYIERWGTQDKAFRHFKADARKAHGKRSDVVSRDAQRLRNASYNALMAEACADKSRSTREARKIAGRSLACDCLWHFLHLSAVPPCCSLAAVRVFVSKPSAVLLSTAIWRRDSSCFTG